MVGQRSRPDLAERFPLVLSCAKSLFFCETQHRQVAALRKSSPDPQVELHPSTAGSRGSSTATAAAAAAATPSTPAPAATTGAGTATPTAAGGVSARWPVLRRRGSRGSQSRYAPASAWSRRPRAC